MLVAAGFLAGLSVALTINSYSQIRIEGAAGVSKHSLAPEGSWWYDGFEKHTELNTPSWMLGVAYFPGHRSKWNLGLRGGYSDLGTVKASNQFPIHEDFSTADARVNPNCDRQTLSGCTGKFTGRGPTKGWYFGPVLERDFGDWTLGAEVGAFYYHSKWVATEWKAVDSQGEFIPDGWLGMQWNQIDKTHVTSYVGASVKWRSVFVLARRYSQVHAADTEKDSQLVGMTSGPVWSVMAGLSLEI